MISKYSPMLFHIFAAILICLMIPFQGIQGILSAKPRLTLIFDDFGYLSIRNSAVSGFLKLDEHFTVSIIPGLRYSTQIAEEFHRAGREIIIHMPMESESKAKQENMTLLTAMTGGEIRSLLVQAMNDIPYAKGMSNHQGSRFTGDTCAVMKLAEVISGGKLYFVDNLTAPNSKAYSLCKTEGIPALKRDVFLDCDLRTDETISDRFRQLVSIANIRGYAVGIGHCRTETLKAFVDFLDSPLSDEVELIFPSQLLETLGQKIN